MKNLGSLILGLIIGALLMYFYMNNLYGSHISNPIIKPRGVISPNQAIVLDSTYNSRHTLISDSIVNRPDNRSSWWSLDDVTNYIDYAKNQSDSLGYNMSGLRIYLGAYPTVKNQVGYTTMFMVPTGELQMVEGSKGFTASANNDIEGANPLNMGTAGNPPNSNYPH